MRPEGKKIPPPKLLITTNLDNDDAFSSDVVELLQRELRPAPGKRIYSLLYGYQYFTDRRFALKMRYTNNHFLTLAEPFDAHTETIIPYRYWLIEGQVSEIDYDIVPGRRMSLRTARTGQMLYPAGFFDLAFEDVQQYDIDGVTVTQRQNAGRITGISWTREGYEYLLYSLQPEMNMIAGLAVEFVTNTRAEAVV